MPEYDGQTDGRQMDKMYFDVVLLDSFNVHLRGKKVLKEKATHFVQSVI